MRRLTLIPILLILAACAPTTETPREAITPFPTPTAGRVAFGDLLPSGSVLLASSGLSAPSTVVAIAPPATATPDFSACPPPNADAALESTPPDNAAVLQEEIERYLNSGGSAATLLTTLRGTWRVIPSDAVTRTDVDYTGEGVADVLLITVAPDEQAALTVFGCRAGSFQVLYEVVSDNDSPPQVLAFADVNRDRRNDILYSVQRCTQPESGGTPSCDWLTQLVTFSPQLSRFVELMPPEVRSVNPPQVLDFDNDEVSEVVVRLENPGTRDTGPLRTGTNVYDWNGNQYVLSIVELDAPRFKIQVLHEGDRTFLSGDYATAEITYRSAIDNTDLRFWFNDEPDLLQSYGLFRLLQAQVVQGSPAQTLTFTDIERIYPDPASAPVYAQMARAFLQAFQTTADVHSACEAVQIIIAEHPEAVEQLNRYGSRSPTYTAQDLCPF